MKIFSHILEWFIEAQPGNQLMLCGETVMTPEGQATFASLTL